jgi:hypothetical protein
MSKARLHKFPETIELGNKFPGNGHWKKHFHCATLIKSEGIIYEWFDWSVLERFKVEQISNKIKLPDSIKSLVIETKLIGE